MNNIILLFIGNKLIYLKKLKIKKKKLYYKKMNRKRECLF